MALSPVSLKSAAEEMERALTQQINALREQEESKLAAWNGADPRRGQTSERGVSAEWGRQWPI
jgi:hypothetical protein